MRENSEKLPGSDTGEDRKDYCRGYRYGAVGKLGDVFDETRVIFDLVMMAHTTGGKERTELEWKNLLEEAGFPGYKITKIPAIPSIIEANPV